MANYIQIGGELIRTWNYDGGQVYSFLPIDNSANAIQVIDYAHHEIHSGNAYFAVRSGTVDTGGTVEVRIQTPDTTKWAHMIIEIDSAIAATAELFKPTTKTHVAGNAITPINRDNNSANTSGLTICHTPAGSESGTAALTQYIGAATTNGRVNIGGATGSRGEFILAQNSSYLVRVTSRADSNALSILLDWYEHTSR
jgi:hypothetical protein